MNTSIIICTVLAKTVTYYAQMNEVGHKKLGEKLCHEYNRMKNEVGHKKLGEKLS